MRRLATLTFLIASFFSRGFSGLQTRWQKEFLGLNARLTAWKQVWPYVVLSLLLIAPLGLSIFPLLRKRQEA